MRTIGFRSNILFVIAAAVGLIAALGRPWYAPTPLSSAEETRIGDVQGPVEGFFSRLAREFSTEGGIAGWDAFTTTDTILTVLVGVAVVSALGALVHGIEQPARELLRLVSLAMLGIVVVKLANTPDAAGLVERRQGAWIALGVTGIMASSAATLYSAPLKRAKRAKQSYETSAVPAPGPRSTAFDSGSVQHTPPPEPY